MILQDWALSRSGVLISNAMTVLHLPLIVALSFSDNDAVLILREISYGSTITSNSIGH
jgi:hypothetical protein